MDKRAGPGKIINGIPGASMAYDALPKIENKHRYAFHSRTRHWRYMLCTPRGIFCNNQKYRVVAGTPHSS